MDEVKKRLESELSRTVERLRQMGGPILSVDVMSRVGDTQLADEVDVIQVNEDREMNFATRSLLVERANRRLAAIGVPVLGAVVNGVRTVETSYGSYHYAANPGRDDEQADA